VPWTSATSTDIAVFGNGAAGPFTVTVSGSNGVGGIIFNANSLYNLSGGTLVLGTTAPGIIMNATSGTIGSVMTGTGTLVASGSGKLTLTGASVYTGGTNINGGTVSVTSLSIGGTSSAALGKGLGLTFTNSGVLNYRGGNTGTPNSVSNGGGWNPNIVMSGNGTFLDNGTANNNGQVTFTGTLSGSGNLTFAGTLTTNAPGPQIFFSTVTANASPNFTGNIIIGQAGDIQLRSSAANPFGPTATVTINPGGMLSADAGNTSPSTLANALILNGGTLCTQSVSMNYSGSVTVNPGTAVRIGEYNNATSGILTLSGRLQGSGTVSTINTSGANSSVQLSGNNSAFTGTWQATSSTHAVPTLFNNSNAGSAQATWMVNGEAFTANITGGGTVSMGALTGISGTINNGVAGTTSIFAVGALGTNTTYGGVIGAIAGGSTALTKVGSGMLTLTNPANVFIGATLVSDGTLAMGNATTLATSTLDTSGTGLMSFLGLTSGTVGGLQGSATSSLALSNTGGAAVALSVGNNNANTLENGSLTGPGSLTKIGNGNLTLGGSNNYVGVTNLNAGILTVANTAALPSTTTLNFNGGTLQYSASNTLDYTSQFNTAPGQLYNISTGGQTVSLSGNITSSAGVLTKVGLGLLVLSGSNTYSGGTNINAGVLQFANLNAVPIAPVSNKSITINNNGALEAISGYATTVNGWLTDPGLQATSNGAIALTPASTDTDVNFAAAGFPFLSLGAVGAVTYGNSIEPGASGYFLGGGGGTLTVSTQLTGTNALSVGNGGGGVVILANSADNWSGPTSIVAGATLQMGDGVANTVFASNTISNNGTLTFLNLTPQTYAGQLSGSGQLNAFGPSVLNFTGSNSTGAFFVNGGGTVNISGNFNSTGKTIIGSSVGTGGAVLNWNATGGFSPSPANYVGIGDGYSATLNINGGSLAVTNSLTGGANTQSPGFFIGNNATGTVNVSAGVLSIAATQQMYVGGLTQFSTTPTVGILNITGGSVIAGTFSGDEVIMGAASNCSGTINLTGGLFQTSRTFISGGGTGSSATFNINGGTLQSTVNSTNWIANGVNVVAGSNGAFIDTQGSTMAIPATIGGPGPLVKLGTGVLQLVPTSGTNNVGSIAINSGILQAFSDAALGGQGATITLNGGELRDNNQGNSLFISANRNIVLGAAGGYIRSGWQNTLLVNALISGSGALTVANDGQGYPGNNVNLANKANTYSGGTSIGSTLASNLNFSNVATAVVSKLADGGSPSSIGLSSSAAANLAFSPSSSGTANFSYVGTGDSTNRLFTVSSGTLVQINSSGSGPLNFTNPGSLVFSGTQPTTLSLGGTYSGAANTFAPQIVDSSNAGNPTSLQINGSLWNVTAGTNSTYTGGTVLSGGTLQVSNANALQNTTVTVNAGKLGFGAGVTSPVLGGLSGYGGIALRDANANPVGTLSVGGNGSTTTYFGSLTGPGGLLKTGSGRLTIGGSQTYTGATTVNSGTLQLGPTVGGFGSNGGGWAFKTTGTNPGVNVSNDVLTLTTTAQGNVATSMWYGIPQSVAGGPWNASFTLNDVFGNGADGGAFVVQTAGTGAIGTAGGSKGFGGLPNPNAGLVWELFNNSQVNILTNGNSTTTSLTAPVNLRAANTPTTFAVSYDGVGTISYTLTQGANVYGPINVSSGSLSSILGNPAGGLATIGFVGADGGTSVTQQVANFIFQMPNVLPATTPVTVNAGATFDLNGGSQTVASLTGLGAVTNSSANYTSVLTFGNLGTSPTFSGTITGNLAVTMAGSGIQTLAGTSSYTGGTTINAGALAIATASALPGSGPIVINYGGGLIAAGAYPTVGAWLSSGTVNSQSNGAILLTPSSTDTLVDFTTSPSFNSLSLGAAGTVTYSGSINPANAGYMLGGGGGTLVLPNSLQDANSVSTNVTINGPGTVVLAAAPGYTGNTTLSPSGVLDLGGNTFTTTATVAFQGGTLQHGTLINNGAYTASGGNVSASLSGTAGLAMNGPGLLLLTGNNSYSGLTSITGGTLQVLAPASLPSFSTSGQVSVSSGASLWVTAGGSGFSSAQLDSLLAGANFSANATLGLNTNNGNFTYASNISQNISLQVLGPNALILSGSNTYTGTTTIGGGTLGLASIGALPSGNITFTGGVLQHSAGNTVDYSAQIQNSTSAMAIDTNGQSVTYGGTIAASNSGGLTKLGSGMLTLNGSNAYLGGTTVSAGTLVAGTTTGLGANTANVLLNPNTSATLVIAAPGTTSIGALSNSGIGTANVVLGAAGGGATTLSTNNISASTFSGAISDVAASGGTGSLVYTGSVSRTLAGSINLGGNVTVGNGTLNVPAGGSLITPAGALAISSGSTSVAAVNLNGGLISVPGIIRGTGTTTSIGNGTLNLNGGTLQAAASNGAFLQQLNGVNVNANTVIDTQANSIAIGQSMLGTGSLTKTGNGVLTLAAPNVYSGGTTLSAGTLAATGPKNLGSGTVTLGGGVLSLQAASTPVTVSGYNSSAIAVNGLAVANGNNSIGGGSIDGASYFYQAGLAGAPGYNLGMPIGGGLMSLANTAVTFQLQNYLQYNDLFLAGSANGTSGTLNLINPGKFSQLNILSTVGNAGTNTISYKVVLNFANGSQSSPYVLSSYDWFNSTTGTSAIALGGVGRASSAAFDFAVATGAANPKLFEGDLTLAASDASQTVNSITLINTGTGTQDLNIFAISGMAGTQNYANSVAVTSNAAIDVSKSLQASVGPLLINSSTLSLTSADTTGGSYSLTTGTVALVGNPTFNVAQSAGGGAGTLTLGALNDSGTAATITETGTGTLILTGTGTFTTGPNGYAGGETVASGTMIVTSAAAIADGSNLIVGNAGAFAPVVPGNVQSAAPVSSVPEPGTVALAVAAMALVGFVVRRRRKG
jgi:autotransporter-associated beta strand protein